MRKLMTCIALAALFAATVPVLASAEPGTFAIARKGSLDVTSSIFVTSRAVDQFGGWANESSSVHGIPYSQGYDRDLPHAAERNRAAPDQGSAGPGDELRRRRSRTSASAGPRASVGLSCPDGRWKPGRYDFVTRTKHLASGLVALGTLSWIRRGTC